MKPAPQNILVIRNDKLGDFMLAWPAFNVLKNIFPAAKILALVPDYTRPAAELCPWIDEVIVDPGATGLKSSFQLASTIRRYRPDAAICFYSRPRTALALLFSGVKQRFAPASRIDQFFYNHRLIQRRSASVKPEYEYNIDLANFMGSIYGMPPAMPDSPPYLKLDQDKRLTDKQNFFTKHQLAENTKIVFVHCGSGGSAINLSINQYARLVCQLCKDTDLFFVLSAGPDEYKQAKILSGKIDKCPHTILHSQQGLAAFIHTLSIADLLICGSTGVLHLAGALDIPTAAFYPTRRSATALRWQTLNSDGNRLAFSASDSEMSSIDINHAVLEIIRQLN